MEQYIRDKYERRLFMSSDARGRIDDGGQTTTSRASLSAASLPASAMERYPLQQKSLQEMGFTNPTANATALHASKGNLQEAIEALLATKRGSPTEEIPPKSTISPKATSPADDLVDIFGAMPPPSKSSSVSQLPPSTSQSTSILDLDLPPPPTATATGEASDEFEDFESAKYVPPPQEPTRRKPSLPEELDDATAPPKFTPPMKNISSVAPDLSNPWASGNSGHGDAFDDIDPFRGFTSKNH